MPVDLAYQVLGQAGAGDQVYDYFPSARVSLTCYCHRTPQAIWYGE